jgi:hypothetical protein
LIEYSIGTGFKDSGTLVPLSIRTNVPKHPRIT